MIKCSGMEWRWEIINSADNLYGEGGGGAREGITAEVPIDLQQNLQLGTLQNGSSKSKTAISTK